MYLLLLSPKKLGIFRIEPYALFNKYYIPSEIYDDMSSLNRFESRLDLDLYLAENLTFDDYYEFHAEYGIQEGKIYTR